MNPKCTYRWRHSTTYHYCRYLSSHYRWHRCEAGCCKHPHREPRAIAALVRTVLTILGMVIAILLIIGGQELL